MKRDRTKVHHSQCVVATYFGTFIKRVIIFPLQSSHHASQNPLKPRQPWRWEPPKSWNRRFSTTVWYVVRVDLLQKTGPSASSFSFKHPRVTPSISYCSHLHYVWCSGYLNLQMHAFFWQCLVIGSAGTPLPEWRSQEAPDERRRTYLRRGHVWSRQWPQTDPHADVL